MYETHDDTYCYANSTVIKNKANLTNEDDLIEFEAAMTLLRSSEPLPFGHLDFEHYKAVHHHLFQDVYDWAGQVRTIRISKGGSMFCYPEHIDAEISKVFAALEKEHYLIDLDQDAFSHRAAHYIAEINAIHPFREGNGRVQLSYLILLAYNAGHPMDLKKLDESKVIQAMIDSFVGNEKPLAELIRAML